MPDKVQLEPTIHVQYCHSCNRGEFMLKDGMVGEPKQMEQWVAEAKTSGRQLSLWFYNCFPRGVHDATGCNGFPGFFAHQFARELKRVQAQGCRELHRVQADV
jgi:hypothetical protein